MSLEYGGEAFVTLSGSVLPSGSLNGRVVVPDGVGFDSVSVEIRQLDGEEPGHIISLGAAYCALLLDYEGGLVRRPDVAARLTELLPWATRLRAGKSGRLLVDLRRPDRN